MKSAESWNHCTMDLVITCNLMAVYYFRKKRHQQRRKYWVHPLMQDRFKFCSFNMLFDKQRKDDVKHMNFYRMSGETFDKLLALLYDHLKHEDTNMRNCNSPPEMLTVPPTRLFRLGMKTVSRIASVVYKKIWKILRGTTGKWMDIAHQFEVMANFPNCIGAIDASTSESLSHRTVDQCPITTKIIIHWF
ncbi:hypothetical protein PR048_029532 [Dryococelus australis]|uniref:Uncharacterized protein n=1 Tax=Dryococelus australis TaxID=614101 RepID=A0ABQ9GG96_9NEOP|nr:hypothetical protein PR048_029532 [Dryococelus australis]